MIDRAVSFLLETEIPSNYVGNMLDFIYQKYLLAQKQRFINISRSNENGGRP